MYVGVCLEAGDVESDQSSDFHSGSEFFCGRYFRSDLATDDDGERY